MFLGKILLASKCLTSSRWKYGYWLEGEGGGVTLQWTMSYCEVSNGFIYMETLCENSHAPV